MQIPTLILTSTVPSMFSLNGVNIGAGEGGKVSLPVSPNAHLFVGVTPILAGYSAILRKIELESGKIANQLSKDVEAIIWQDGIIEIVFNVPKTLFEKKFSPKLNDIMVQTFSKPLKFGGAAQILQNDFDAVLSVENKSGSVIFNAPIFQSKQSFALIKPELKLETVDQNDCSLVFASATNKAENLTHCLCVCVEKNVKPTYYNTASEIIRDGGTIISTKVLKSSRNHEQKQTVDMRSGKVLQTQIGFFNNTKKPIINALQAAQALLDGVLLCQHNDINDLLGGELAGLSLATLKDFFGDFVFASVAPSQLGERTVLGLIGKSENQISKARLFSFECELEKSLDPRQTLGVWKVVNAYEL